MESRLPTGPPKLHRRRHESQGCRESRQVGKGLTGAYLAVGIHPVNAGKPGQTISNLAKHLNDPKLVALGETGLDYFRRENPPRDVQMAGLRAHLGMAKAANLPVVIHTRPCSDLDADVGRIHDDLLSVLRDEPSVVCIIHCFSGGVREGELLIDAGHYISFAGNLTYDSRLGCRLREAARCLPLDRLLVETDAPYVRPIARSGRNEPAFIIDTLTQLAQCRRTPLDAVASVVLQNSQRVLRLDTMQAIQAQAQKLQSSAAGPATGAPAATA